MPAKHWSEADIIRHHHESYDGRGYPDGLKGQEIPLLSRVITLADSFDAITSDRPYRKGLPFATALAEIERCKGTQFDPDLADVFMAFPYTLFVIAMIAVMGNGIQNVFIAIGILGWPSIARVSRPAEWSASMTCRGCRPASRCAWRAWW